MKTWTEESPLVLRDVLGQAQPDLFLAEDAAPVENSLLERLEELPAGGLLPIDFADVRVASEAARGLLRRAIARITGGELSDRFIVLEHLGRNRYNVRVMLETEGLTVVERTDDRAQLLGKVEPAMRDTYEFMLTRAAVTAKDVFEHFGLNNISTATNRLTNLAKLAVVRRIAEQPVTGGGRQFVYAAVR